MAFYFRFEKLLRLKERREDELKKEYFIQMNQYYKLMQDLAELKEARDEAIIRRKEMERKGLSASRFDLIENFLKGNKEQCIQKIGEIKKQRGIADAKKQELLYASKEKSIFKKLREKAFKNYRIEKEALAINELDDISSAYYGRDY